MCRYEAGKWRHIQKDSEFGPVLKNRSNVDLKDKWRNLNMDSGGSRRDSRGGGGDKVPQLQQQKTQNTLNKLLGRQLSCSHDTHLKKRCLAMNTDEPSRARIFQGRAAKHLMPS